MMDIKLKNKLFVIGFLVSLFMVYKFAIFKTLETRSEVAMLSKEKRLLTDISNKVSDLEAKEVELDAMLKKRNISISNSFQQTLLQNITTLTNTNKLQIIAFEKLHVYKKDITKLHTYTIEVKGSFSSLLKFVNNLENLQIGELISIKYEKRKDFKRNKNYLTCNVLFQRIDS